MDGTGDARLVALVAELGQSLGLGELVLDGDGLCALSVDGRATLHIAADRTAADRANLYVPLPAPPEAQRPELHERLLEANFASSPIAILALDPDSGRPVVLMRLAVEGLSYPGFVQAIEAILGEADRWQAELSTGMSGGTLPRDVPPSPRPHDAGQLRVHG